MLKQLAKQTATKMNLLGPYRAIRRRLRHTLHPNRHHQQPFYTLSPDLLIALNSCFRQGQEMGILDGSDYMEFGVYRGFALWYAEACTREMGVDGMRYFGFDSFQGLPETRGLDRNGDFRKGMYSVGLDLVKSNLARYGSDPEKTFLVPGFYSDTLNAFTASYHGLGRCSVCVIDCDLYEAARQALDFAGPLLGDRAFLIFDDWNCYGADPEKGERKAFAEFLKKNPSIQAADGGRFGGNCQVFLLEKAGAALSR